MKEIEAARNIHSASRRCYKHAIRRSKFESWQNFVREHGNENPWEIVYRVVMDRLPHTDPLYYVRLDTGGHTFNWSDTLSAIMETLIHLNVGPLAEEQVKKIQVRDTCTTSNLFPPFTGDNCTAAVNTFRNGRVPGLTSSSLKS